MHVKTYVVTEGGGIVRQWMRAVAVTLSYVELVTMGIGGKQGVEICSVERVGSRLEHRKHDCEKHHE